jgi:hypothetical protein
MTYVILQMVTTPDSIEPPKLAICHYGRVAQPRFKIHNLLSRSYRPNIRWFLEASGSLITIVSTLESSLEGDVKLA